MVQLENEAAAVAEADVTETAPDNSQGNIETPEVNEADAPDTTEQALYEDDQPQDADDFDEDDDGEGPPEPKVTPPASLKAEEKDKFAQLPEDAQRVLSEVLQRRDSEIQQGLEAARTAQRQAQQSAADDVAETQHQYAQQFEQLAQAFQPTPPPLELARTNPAEYQYRKAVFDEEFGTYQQLVGRISGLNQSEQHFGAQQQAWLQEEAAKLRSIPEIADESARPEFLRTISEIGKEMGYDDADLEQVNAKDVFALNKVRSWKSDAEKWRQHIAKRNQRPRAAQGRFASAGAGNGAPAQGGGETNTLKALYPHD